MVENSHNSITFSVDAGLIDRLGRELVGKAETAVSELVKNAYDADARNVEVRFINSLWSGGILEIIDDGLGMNYDQLKSGFMTISSTDKVHNPVSVRYKRNRAGKKGIGRFATQRLGKKLIILTQTLDSNLAIKLTINWDRYTVDQDITSINNQIEYLPKEKPEGTTLIIENLREVV
jgi:Histidine kinase-, DNA gyrase B-, and HSP90-like ATPase